MRIKTEKPLVKRILISGIVQGVGFRPFVYNLAEKMKLVGFARNIGGGVEIVVLTDDECKIRWFVEKIKNEAPIGSRIDGVIVENAVNEIVNTSSFKILESVGSERTSKAIPPDISVCENCLRELNDRANRRYQYPFISCTYCGPRFTVIEDLPYDRERTTMNQFSLCQKCSDEYYNPTDRRFYAQTTACSECGPKVFFRIKDSIVRDVKAIKRAREVIKDGGVVVIKGLGGFCLSCDAFNTNAVNRIKEFKMRPDKPMAVMVRDIEVAKKIAWIENKTVNVLKSPSAPIVVFPKRRSNKKLSILYNNVSKGVSGIGVMLPNNPVHHLLFEDIDFPIVMTSANVFDEPIITDDDEASLLLECFDGVLINNRKISARADDSLMITDGNISVICRAGRGLSPITLVTTIDSPDIIALGSDIKNTFSFMKDGVIYNSQHIGDLESVKTFEFYKCEIERQSCIYDIKNPLPICDLSPVYNSSRYAYSFRTPVKVQHHYAHLVSVLAEEGITEGRFLGLSLDGTGYGTDGAVWGCEVMEFDLSSFRRLAHLEYTPMPGGASAIKNPYRMAYAYLKTHLKSDELNRGFIKSFIDLINEEERSVIEWTMKDRTLSPLTSSLGRLFDGVSAFLGLCRTATYEAQPAMILETIAEKGNLSPYKYSISNKDGLQEINIREIFIGIAEDIERGLSIGEVSYRFHLTVADALSSILIKEARKGYSSIVLSGGCFQNILLLKLFIDNLSSSGQNILYNKRTPINDGNISIGQALIGGYRYRRE
ncbi:MAG: carbamoyltransferase HypF [bacterium]